MCENRDIYYRYKFSDSKYFSRFLKNDYTIFVICSIIRPIFYAKYQNLHYAIREGLSTLYHESRAEVTDQSRTRWSHRVAHGIWCRVTRTSPQRASRLRDLLPRSEAESSSYPHHWHYLWVQNPRNGRRTHEGNPLPR